MAHEAEVGGCPGWRGIRTYHGDIPVFQEDGMVCLKWIRLVKNL